MFELISYVKTVKWEGILMKDIFTEKQYYSNGVYKWEVTPELIKKCEVVNSINTDKFLTFWNRNLGKYHSLRGVKSKDTSF